MWSSYRAVLRCAVQVGGLGDVVTGLARATLARGHNVEIMLPFYESLPTDSIEDLRQERNFQCPKVRLLVFIFFTCYACIH